MERQITLTVAQDQLDELEGYYTASGWDFNPTYGPVRSDPAHDRASGKNTRGKTSLMKY